MDSVEEYARQWAKREHAELDTLSEWVKTIRSIILKRISSLKSKMKTKRKSIFLDHDVQTTLNDLHDQYVVVSADKASNNLIFVCNTITYTAYRKSWACLITKETLLIRYPIFRKMKY